VLHQAATLTGELLQRRQRATAPVTGGLGILYALYVIDLIRRILDTS
jgi:hypothetical protein